MTVITDADRAEARAAMIIGRRGCRALYPSLCSDGASRPVGPSQICKCDLGAVDGCVARVEAIAAAIARARPS